MTKAAKGKTIKLLDDLDISATGLTIAAAKTVTLDLDGHTLKAANTNTGNIKVLGKLTLCDSTDTAKNGTGTGKVWTDTPYIYNKQDKVLIAAIDGGTFTMESGLIDTASSIADNANDGQFAVSVQNEHADATVIINGGHIKAGWYAVAGNGTDITYNGNITVNGGILESVADYAIYHPHTGTTTVNGGVIFGAAGGISLNRGKLIVNDGTITSKGTGTTGNWGDGTGNQQAAAINVNAKYETTAVEIKGGKITAEKDAILLTNGRNGTVAVSGGSFSSEIKPEYCAEGFVPAANADGTYGVKAVPVAKIGTVEYATLAEAIAAAKDGDTVTLTADINTPETSYYIQKSLTIDLGGKTLTGSGYDGVFNIEGENAAVLIKNGKIVAVEQTGTAGKYTMAVWACAAGCEVTLEDLDVSQQITHTDDKQMDMIYTSKGTIIINSGCFASGTPAWTLNCKDSAYKDGTAKIIVNGGTFVKFDPSDSASENPHANFLAEGYGVKQDGDNYIVTEPVAAIGDTKYPTLAAAISAANNNTVTLLKDTKEDITIPSGKTITLNLNGMTLTNVNDHTILNNGNLTITGTGKVDNISHAKGALYNKGTVIVNGGTFDRTKENGKNKGESGQNSWYTIKNVGTMTINDGAIVQTAGNNASLGKFSSLVSNGYFNAGDYTNNKGLDQPILTIDGGMFRGGLNTIKNDDRAKLTINGGTFSNYYQAVVQNHNIAEITGGTFTAASDANAETYGIYNCGCGAEIDLGTLTVSGGTFTGATYAVAEVSSQNAAVNISGGQFAGTKAAIVKSSTSNATIAISGGLFSSDPSAYVAAGHYVDASNNGDYPYTVKEGTKPAGALIVVKDKTEPTVSGDITGTDKTAINNVIGNANVDGVAEAAKKADIVAKSGATVAENDKVEIEVAVKVEAKAADLAKGQLTFEASPVATVKVNGTVKGTVPVSNGMLNNNPITVKLPLPTVDGKLFTPKQILHKFTGGGYEYFINESVGGMRGAGSFKIEDNCAVFTIYGFSTFELSGTVTYVVPSSGGGSSSSSRRYDVSAPSVKHGDVTVSPKNASKGDTVTITVKPDSGYELDTLTVKDASGSKIKVKDKGDGKFTFTMPASKVTVSAEFAEIETLDFADVSTDAYYYEAVKWAAKKGITGGTGDGTFNPNGSCTRAHIVTFLWRAAGSPEPKSTVSFADVPADSYYAKAVAWAVENGITLGTGDGTFSPNATCTRAQSVTFLYRALGTAPTTVNGFTDVTADAFYADAVAWAVESGVTNGTSASTFSPNNGCTRAQIVTFLYRTMK